MATTKVRCANCSHEFNIDGRIDEDMNKETSCPNCRWTVSAILFDVVMCDTDEEEDE